MGGFVQSPIPTAAAERMNDDQWLGAMDRYSGDEREWNRIDEGIQGGAYELAQELERQAKAEPARFAELAERMADSVNTAYFAAILRGVATTDAEIDDAVVGPLCRRCHALPTRPCGRGIVDAIGRLARVSDVPDDLAEIVIWYAINDPHPQTESWREIPAGSDNPYFGGDPFTAGINSVRGNAVEAVAQLVAYDRVDVRSLEPTLSELVLDTSVAVRSCVGEVLLALLQAHPEMAVGLFLQLVDADDALLTTPYIERFLLYASRTHLADTRSGAEADARFRADCGSAGGWATSGDRVHRESR